MGCDGGTIPRRDELVKVKKKPEAKDKTSELAFQWLHCSVSQQILSAPVVMCGLGRLYNKMALIEGLLNRRTLPETAKHIRSLKDVKDLVLTPNPEYKPGDNKKEGSVDERACPYICPITAIEMSGKFKFVALWTCGCVFSERTLKQINSKLCIKCQQPFTDDDVVILNAKDADLEEMQSKMERRQQAMKKNKDKKCKVKKELIEGSSSSSSSESKAPPVNSKSVGSLTTSKRPGAIVTVEKNKKIKSDYSVAKDSDVSDVYKSIFTTHKSEQEQNRAHWVTYNPFYN